MKMLTDHYLENGMPCSVDAERSVLGAIMLSNDAFYEASSILVPGDFSLDSHRRIYQAMCDLMDQGAAIDCITMSDQLARSKVLDSIGGIAYLSSLPDGVPSRPSIAQYVQIVRGKAQLRQVIHLCTGVLARASDQSEKPDALLGDAHAEILKILANSQKQNDAQYLVQFSDEVFNDLLRLREQQGLIGLSTGIDVLDKKTTGIRESQLWLLGGKTGDGKSCISTQCAYANAVNDVPVAIFAVEMTKGETLQRLWTQNFPVERAAEKIRNPKLMTPAEVQILEQIKNSVGLKPIIIKDSPSLDIREFDAQARLLVKREGVRLIIVDHVHEMTSAKAQNIRERFIDVAEGLRQFVKSTTIPVYAAAQLPKPDKSNLNRRPTRHDFKETGSFEEKAHVCLLIYREVDETGLPTGNDELIIGKQRFGGFGIAPVTLNTHSLLYEKRGF
jgi:replicative DNA helicase